MKKSGVEVKRATKAAQPVKQTQRTQPSKPLKSSFPRHELGDSGTRTLKGIITEEYNGSLQGVQGIKVYDEMRKSDGTVRAACLVTTLPIRRAEWFVKPGSEDSAEDKDIADFIEHALFEWLDITWDDVLRQALLMVPFGVMAFEKVYGVKEFDGKTYVTLEKLAPRLPRSIQQWELTDGTFGIQQVRQDGHNAEIPGSKLLVFVNEREGDNWWGTSMLRAAYKHWYFKNNFYKIDAVAFERQGIGVPMIKMPEGYTENDEAHAKKALQNLRANEHAYLILPPGYEAEFMAMGASSTRDPESSIMHHNREIMKSVLAQFLELGAQSKGGSGGARALSQDHSEIFLKSIEAIANTIADEFNKNLIKELVDLNFDGVENYPKLDYGGISSTDVATISAAYAQLVTAGGVKPIDDDEQYFRAMMGLPPLTQEEIDKRELKEKEMAEQTKTNPNESTVDDAAEEAEKPTDPKQEQEVDDKTKKKAHEHNHEHRKRIFGDGDGYKSWRPLTFAEKKVNWKKVEGTMENMQQDFSVKAQELLTDAKDAYMVKLHRALETGDQKAIAELELRFGKDYQALLKDAMRDAYVYGKNNASVEMGVKPPANTASTLATIDLRAKTIAQKTAADLAAKARVSAANFLTQNTAALQASGAIDAMLDEAIGKSIRTTGAIVVPQSINNGRYDVFERYADDIYALQRSEILDKNTCNFCLSMDGRIVELKDVWAQYDIFHADCRGIWVEILKDEENKPEITGVPDALDDYYEGQPNALTQPPRPIVDKGSLVDDYLQSQKDE